MALKEQDIVFHTKDANGNTVIQFPITRVENVEGALKTVNGNSPGANGNISPSQTGCLPLTGGTMTGGVKTSVEGFIVSDADTKAVRISGGSAYASGASVIAYGKDHANYPGAFRMRATNGTDTADLDAWPSGEITWEGKNLVRSVNGATANAAGDVTIDIPTGFLPLSGGTMTGGISTSVEGILVGKDDTVGLRISGGTGWNNGSSVVIYGKDHASYPGMFRVKAKDGTNESILLGKPDGSLTWGGKNVLTSTNETTLKYLIDEAQFSTDSLATAFNYGLLWLCIELFDDTSDVNTSVGVGGTVANYHDATNHLIVKTGSGSIVLQSKAQTCSKNNASAWVSVDYTGTGSVTVQISRNNGTNFTTCSNNSITSISSQPSGTSMVCKLTLTGVVTLKNIAWGCK